MSPLDGFPMSFDSGTQAARGSSRTWRPAAGRGQPELRRVLDGLQADDMVVMPQLDGLGRSLSEVGRRMQHITVDGAGLRSLQEGLDTATDAGRAAVAVVGSLAGLDRGAAHERIGAGPAVAGASSRKRRRHPKLTGQQRALLAAEVLSGRETAAKADGPVPDASRPVAELERQLRQQERELARHGRG